MKKEKLTAKQRLFIEEYQKDWNGTQAIIRAGYSPKRAGEKAYALLQIPKIKDAVDRKIEVSLQKIGVHRERVLRELATVAFSDVTKAFREDGTLNPPPSCKPKSLGHWQGSRLSNRRETKKIPHTQKK